MAQQVTTTCDRCKKTWEGQPALTLTLWDRGERRTKDLCAGCLQDMVEWIDAGEEPEK